MSIGEKQMVGIIRDVTSANPDLRSDACGTITDWKGSFGAFEVRLLARLLTTLAVAESDETCRENQLHAAYELLDTGFVTAEDIGPIRHLDRTRLDPSETEYVNYMIEEYFPDAGE